LLAFSVSGLLRADIASLQRFGPRSFIGYANPGRAFDQAQNVPIAMREAKVEIRFTRDGRNALKAAVKATFQMENQDGTSHEACEFLVGFPVSREPAENGESANVTESHHPLRVANFAVVVDGKPAPLAKRESVFIGRNYWDGQKPQDTPLQGTLAGRFAAPTFPAPNEKTWDTRVHAGHVYPERYWGGLAFADQTKYETTYVWTQKIAAGARQSVEVNYTLLLEGQKIAFLEITTRGGEANILPTEKTAGLDPKKRYALFDYVLRSGATWDGPIGRETITLTADDGINLDGLVSYGRKPRLEGKTWVWELVNEKPLEDVLVAVPL
jgi:hypothetical protein